MKNVHIFLLTLVFLISCSKKDVDNTFTEDPSLLSQQEQVIPTDFPESLPEVSQIEKSETVVDQSSEEFAEKISWNSLSFAQKNSAIIQIENSDTLLKNIALSKSNEKFFPVDTYLGPLEDEENSDLLIQKIVNLTKDFITQIQKQTVSTNLNKFVIKDSLPIIQRQLAEQSKYADNIQEFRIGKVKTAKGNLEERFTKVRVLGKQSGKDTHTLLDLYFAKELEQWKIVAVEGNFNDLLIPYEKRGDFTPSGTTGVLQAY